MAAPESNPLTPLFQDLNKFIQSSDFEKAQKVANKSKHGSFILHVYRQCDNIWFRVDNSQSTGPPPGFVD